MDVLLCSTIIQHLSFFVLQFPQLPAFLWVLIVCSYVCIPKAIYLAAFHRVQVLPGVYANVDLLHVNGRLILYTRGGRNNIQFASVYSSQYPTELGQCALSHSVLELTYVLWKYSTEWSSVFAVYRVHSVHGNHGIAWNSISNKSRPWNRGLFWLEKNEIQCSEIKWRHL